MNLVIHSWEAGLFSGYADKIQIITEDTGPGIPNIELAMKKVTPPRPNRPGSWGLVQVWVCPISSAVQAILTFSLKLDKVLHWK